MGLKTAEGAGGENDPLAADSSIESGIWALCSVLILTDHSMWSSAPEPLMPCQVTHNVHDICLLNKKF